MSRRLPPLNALRAFEAAARHLSFTRAAAELNVTQAAISHQVKALEERLGVRLFRRLNRALLLSEEGQAYLPPVRDALDTIAAATERLVAHDVSGTLNISVSPSVAAMWLVPRLAGFRKAHPEIDVRISADDRLTDFARDDVDLVIRYGRGHYPGLASMLLMTEDVFPVCSPAILDGPPALRRPADLGGHTLLHDDPIGVADAEALADWRMWLLAAGVEGIDSERGPRFSHSNLLLQAAIDGQGVALGRTPLVANEIAGGRLVKPFELSLPASFAYYIVCPEAAAERPKVAAFREWLIEEAGETGGAGEGPGG